MRITQSLPQFLIPIRPYLVVMKNTNLMQLPATIVTSHKLLPLEDIVLFLNKITLRNQPGKEQSDNYHSEFQLCLSRYWVAKCRLIESTYVCGCEGSSQSGTESLCMSLKHFAQKQYLSEKRAGVGFLWKRIRNIITSMAQRLQRNRALFHWNMACSIFTTLIKTWQRMLSYLFS